MGSIAANTLLVIILLINVPTIDTTMVIKINFDIITHYVINQIGQMRF
jgi:hypothetical protein